MAKLTLLWLDRGLCSGNSSNREQIVVRHCQRINPYSVKKSHRQRIRRMMARNIDLEVSKTR